MVPTIDGGKRAESGQGGHRPGKRRGLPRGRARADDRRRARRSSTWQRIAVPVVPTIDAGKLTAGKLVIVPTCRGHRPGNVPRSPWCRRAARGADDRRRQVCRVRASWSSTRQRVAVPVVPMIDAGQFQGQAGYRAARGADDRRREADGGQLGKAVIDLASAGAFPRLCPCRRSTAGN